MLEDRLAAGRDTIKTGVAVDRDDVDRSGRCIGLGGGQRLDVANIQGQVHRLRRDRQLTRAHCHIRTVASRVIIDNALRHDGQIAGRYVDITQQHIAGGQQCRSTQRRQSDTVIDDNVTRGVGG